MGTLALAWGATGLLACSYAGVEAVTAAVSSAGSCRDSRFLDRLDQVRRALDGYLSGRRREIALPVDLRLATPFGRRVLEATAGIEYGTTASYGAIAAEIGSPRASRAVGAALGANPVCIVVPCHRVLRTGGALGGYAGGLDAKRYLLALETGRRTG
ncbi:MAG: methylated-DNA-[protein]-cysteine S-methyltransferase [Frankiales bacterium]|nr:methylated-DNA-[protein]-cysteine S-methyltransferase [Frankiales bacterium]